MLQGKVVLVTGGARGIGLGIATSFLAAGAKVMIGDLGAGSDWTYNLSSKQDMEKVLKQYADLGDLDATELDVTSAESARNAVSATVQRFGGIDILVNNAGVVGSGPVETFSEQEWDRIFAVNTKGIFLMTQAALPELKKRPGACVVNTASIAGKKGHANMSAYCGSKFAAIGITQAMANEFARDGIRVNAICPGIVGTAMWLDHLMPTNVTDQAEKTENFEARMRKTIPLGRSQTTQDMGQAAVFLASSPNITGVSLTVAGGIEMN
ncbi:MAG: SDR family oxidoreductase [Proteobacteria bacterium]|nr:SDR family oxidoreductase [Pseudomonadota bacterium]